MLAVGWPGPGDSYSRKELIFSAHAACLVKFSFTGDFPKCFIEVASWSVPFEGFVQTEDWRGSQHWGGLVRKAQSTYGN